MQLFACIIRQYQEQFRSKLLLEMQLLVVLWPAVAHAPAPAGSEARAQPVYCFSLFPCLTFGVHSSAVPRAPHCKQQWKYNAALDSKQEIRRIRPNIRRGIRSRTAGTIARPSWARRLPQAERRNPAYAMVQPLELKNPAHWPGEDALINDNESVALYCTVHKRKIHLPLGDTCLEPSLAA